MSHLLRLTSWAVACVLLFFTARRWLFMITALLQWPVSRQPHHPKPDNNFLPHVLLLAPIRNEAQSLPDFLSALTRLAYPAEQLTLVMIDDGSTDNSQDLLERWVANQPNRHLLSLDQNRGKATALNLALARFPQGDIIAVYDADERPQPNTLQALISPFTDKKVGGVTGRRAVSNALAGVAAGYTTFEGLVHQLITMRAKDKLKLAPAILGANCAYRRLALAQAGYFKPGALLEDSDLTLKLACAGWQTRFVPEAVSYHRVPQTLSGYWRQHTRWARGFNDVAGAQGRLLLFDKHLPLPLRLELLTFSLGYLDRLALLAAGGLLLLSRFRLLTWVLALTLLTPLCQIIAALKIGGETAAMWSRLIWVPFFFGLDIAMAVTGFAQALLNRPKVWEERTMRA